MSVKEWIEKIMTHSRDAQLAQIELGAGWLINIYHKHQEMPSILKINETVKNEDDSPGSYSLKTPVKTTSTYNK